MSDDADIVRGAWRFVMLDDREAVEYIRAEAGPALERLAAIHSAAEWLVANRGHRGEPQAWKLLVDALAQEQP